MATINGIDLGDVQSERIMHTTNLIKFSLAAGEAANTFLLNLGGKKRVILLQGTWSGNAAALTNDIDGMNDWVNPQDALSVQATRTFTPTLAPSDGPYTVNCEEFNYEYSETNPSIVKYTIKLIQGSITGT